MTSSNTSKRSRDTASQLLTKRLEALRAKVDALGEQIGTYYQEMPQKLDEATEFVRTSERMENKNMRFLDGEQMGVRRLRQTGAVRTIHLEITK